MPEATQPKPPRPPPPAPQPTPKPVAASPKPIKSVLVKDNGDKVARHLGERVPGFQRLSESWPDDTFYVKREMLALWATITPKIAAQFNPSGKVTKADLEKLAYAPKGSDKTPKSSYTSAVALGAVPVTMRVACSAENAQATLQKLHNAKKLQKQGYLTHEDLVVNRTMVLNKSNDPGEKIRSAIRAKLVASASPPNAAKRGSARSARGAFRRKAGPGRATKAATIASYARACAPSEPPPVLAARSPSRAGPRSRRSGDKLRVPVGRAAAEGEP